MASGPICVRGIDYTCNQDSIVAFQALTSPQYTPFSQGRDQTENLTISGGVPTLTYSLTGSLAGSLGYLKLPGIEQAARTTSSMGRFLVICCDRTTMRRGE